MFQLDLGRFFIERNIRSFFAKDARFVEPMSILGSEFLPRSTLQLPGLRYPVDLSGRRLRCTPSHQSRPGTIGPALQVPNANRQLRSFGPSNIAANCSGMKQYWRLPSGAR